MSKNGKIEKVDVICWAVTLIIWLLSFSYESVVFEVQYRSQHVMDYVLCRILEFGVIFFAVRMIWLCMQRNGVERSIIKNGMPYYLILLICHFAIGIFPFEGDELNIYNAAIKYDAVRGFSYFTGYFYMVCLFIVPAMVAIIQIKMLLQALVIGYVIYRFDRLYHSKWCNYLVYLFACLPWVLVLAVSAHRMPTYAILYILLVIKAFCDYKENCLPSRKNLILIAVMISVLTWWRTEGIYLSVLGFFIICIVYRISKKEIRKVCFLLVVVQVLLASLQLIPTQGVNSSYAEHRMAPFYGYTVTIMCLEGLDKEKNIDELQLIDKYISVDKIAWLNDQLGNRTYDDVYIMFPEDYPSESLSYNGIREYATENDYKSFVTATWKLIFNNPEVFVKAKIHAWNWISFSWLSHESYIGRNIKGILMFLVLGITGNLYVPLLMLVFVCVLSLRKKDWLHVVFSLCGIGHGGLSFLLMPAAYFKYFYIMYLLGNMYLLGALAWWLHKKQIRRCYRVEKEETD